MANGKRQTAIEKRQNVLESCPPRQAGRVIGVLISVRQDVPLCLEFGLTINLTSPTVVHNNPWDMGEGETTEENSS